MQAQLLSQLKRHEGSRRDAAGRHVAYRCSAGALTIGYGHNLDANPLPGIGPKSRLDEQEAEQLLQADLDRIAGQLDHTLPWAAGLTPARKAVLLNMAFNLGVNGLLGFTNTLAAVRAGLYAEAARRMLQSKWAGQVGRRASELARQMETGAWESPLL